MSNVAAKLRCLLPDLLVWYLTTACWSQLSLGVWMVHPFRRIPLKTSKWAPVPGRSPNLRVPSPRALVITVGGWAQSTTAMSGTSGITALCLSSKNSIGWIPSSADIAAAGRNPAGAEGEWPRSSRWAIWRYGHWRSGFQPSSSEDIEVANNDFVERCISSRARNIRQKNCTAMFQRRCPCGFS